MNAPQAAPRDLTPAEAALRLGVTPATIRLWIRRGVLPAYRLGAGRFYRIAAADLVLARVPARRVSS